MSIPLTRPCAAIPRAPRLIFESLRRLPGVTAIRGYQPFLRLLPDRDSTILLLGIDPRPFAMQPAGDLREFEELAARGNRLVLGMRPGSGRAPPRRTALELNWGVRFGLDFDKAGNDILYFAEARHWDVLERNGQRPVVIEKAFGKGSIVLVAAGWLFEQQIRGRSAPHRAAGPHHADHAARTRASCSTKRTSASSRPAASSRWPEDSACTDWRSAWLSARRCSFGRTPPAFHRARTPPPAKRFSAGHRWRDWSRFCGGTFRPAASLPVCWQEWLKSNAREITPERRAQAEAVVRDLS